MHIHELYTVLFWMFSSLLKYYKYLSSPLMFASDLSLRFSHAEMCSFSSFIITIVLYPFVWMHPSILVGIQADPNFSFLRNWN